MQRSTERTLKDGARVQHCGKDKALNRVSRCLSEPSTTTHCYLRDRQIDAYDLNISTKTLADTEQCPDLKLLFSVATELHDLMSCFGVLLWASQNQPVSVAGIPQRWQCQAFKISTCHSSLIALSWLK